MAYSMRSDNQKFVPYAIRYPLLAQFVPVLFNDGIRQ